MEQKRFYVFKANASSRSSGKSAPSGADGGPGKRPMSIADVERSKPVQGIATIGIESGNKKRKTSRSVTPRKLEIQREDLDDAKSNAASNP